MSVHINQVEEEEKEDFIVDLENGQCMIFYANGDKYKGGWKNGNYHGQGTMIYADGSKYEGEWKNGNYHGQGTVTYADGTKYEGVWKNGKFLDDT